MQNLKVLQYLKNVAILLFFVILRYLVIHDFLFELIYYNANKSATAIISVFIKLEAEKATCVDLTKQIENIMYIFYCITKGRVGTK